MKQGSSLFVGRPWLLLSFRNSQGASYGFPAGVLKLATMWAGFSPFFFTKPTASPLQGPWCLRARYRPEQSQEDGSNVRSIGRKDAPNKSAPITRFAVRTFSILEVWHCMVLPRWGSAMPAHFPNTLVMVCDKEVRHVTIINLSHHRQLNKILPPLDGAGHRALT